MVDHGLKFVAVPVNGLVWLCAWHGTWHGRVWYGFLYGIEDYSMVLYMTFSSMAVMAVWLLVVLCRPRQYNIMMVLV